MLTREFQVWKTLIRSNLVCEFFEHFRINDELIGKDVFPRRF